MIKERTSISDLFFDYLINGYVIFLLLIIIYPLYFIVIASFSNPDLVNIGKVILLPKEITFSGYEMIFKDNRIWQGYLNSLLYSGGFCILAVTMTILAGYALSRKELYGRNVIMLVFIATMYFNGGLIPTYLVVRQLHLVNNPMVIIIMGSLSVYYTIITRMFFEGIVSEELRDAALVDGCNEAQFFTKIVLPLSKAIIAVMALYYVVMQWNSYFNALIYLNDSKYYPLQLVLRNILINSQRLQEQIIDLHSIGQEEKIADLIKYGVIIVSSLPVLILYPFVQKFFVQGIMIGSIKG